MLLFGFVEYNALYKKYAFQNLLILVLLIYSHWRWPVEQDTERNETWRQSPRISIIVFTGLYFRFTAPHCCICIIWYMYIKILTRSLKLGGDFKLILLSFVDIFSFSKSAWLVQKVTLQLKMPGKLCQVSTCEWICSTPTSFLASIPFPPISIQPFFLWEWMRHLFTF